MDIEAQPSERVISRADLTSLGYTRRRLARALAGQELRRLRRDCYVFADPAYHHADRAVRVGGRITCLTLIAMLGGFVLSDHRLHVRVAANASRLRHSSITRRPLTKTNKDRSLVVHWGEWASPPPGRDAVALLDAVRDLITCQHVRSVVATLDSLLHQGMVTMLELTDLIATLPSRYGVILTLVNERAESGPESIVRLLLGALGASCELQVDIEGVGRVDLVVDGWLIIECDSKAYHSSWEQQAADRRRDLAAARLGYTTIRPIAKDILDDPEGTAELLRDVLSSPVRRG